MKPEYRLRERFNDYLQNVWNQLRKSTSGVRIENGQRTGDSDFQRFSSSAHSVLQTSFTRHVRNQLSIINSGNDFESTGTALTQSITHKFLTEELKEDRTYTGLQLIATRKSLLSTTYRAHPNLGFRRLKTQENRRIKRRLHFWQLKVSNILQTMNSKFTRSLPFSASFFVVALRHLESK